MKKAVLPHPKAQELIYVLGVSKIEICDEGTIYINKEGMSFASLEDFLVGSVFKFCTCGTPSDIIITVGKFLETYSFFRKKMNEALSPNGTKALFKEAFSQSEEWFSSNKELHSFLLYYLDSIEFLEHGGSICAAWLTKKGEAYIEIYKYLILCQKRNHVSSK